MTVLPCCLSGRSTFSSRSLRLPTRVIPDSNVIRKPAIRLSTSDVSFWNVCSGPNPTSRSASRNLARSPISSDRSAKAFGVGAEAESRRPLRAAALAQSVTPERRLHLDFTSQDFRDEVDHFGRPGALLDGSLRRGSEMLVRIAGSDDRVLLADRRPNAPIVAITVNELDLQSLLVERHGCLPSIKLRRLDCFQHLAQLVVEHARCALQRVGGVRQLHTHLVHRRPQPSRS